MQDFLLELGFEELPARFVERALGQLVESATKKLQQERLTYGEVIRLSSPRRLALLIRDLQTEQEDVVEAVKGPPLNIAKDEHGDLTKAGQGFLRSQGAQASQITIKQFQGADYIYIQKEVRGQKTNDLLKPLLEDIIAHLSFPKNMHWGDYELRYARPLRWMVALLGQDVIPLQVGPVQADRLSYGHRQLGPGPLTISNPDEYRRTLSDNYVLVDAEERRSVTWDQIQQLAAKEGAQVLEDERLLDEVVNLVEYPTAFCGSFSPEYLEMPSEVLITSMKEHQRYFPLHSALGALEARFIGVRNGADNHLDNVIAGNEKVLEARLSDAKFFYDEDLQINLVDNLQKLEGVVFQEKLGTMGDKVRRLQALTTKLIEELGHYDQKGSALRTALLAKCDLVSQMVYEFPELQGMMGEKYALAQGEDASVAAGIREHYKPRFSGDSLPMTVEGTVVSLSDKLDTLVGYFAVGSIPTGSQDPFALRRQAQGVVQILLKKGYDVSLTSLIEAARSTYTDLQLGQENAQALLDFFLARLRVLLTDQGFAYDVIDAAMASGDDRIHNLLGRVQALTEFRERESCEDLIIGFERVVNLAAKAENQSVVAQVFTEADHKFHQAVQDLQGACQELVGQQDYAGILQTLADFRLHVDGFFDDVMIMDPDPVIRANRLALLKQSLDLYSLCGDLRLIVVNK
ncbi:MAG: glycine--tRNA ligase subunit beta [Limnochordia bacterium]|nr:glycine--tRNA ligase subunit beta [Limnochordia bacterium]